VHDQIDIMRLAEPVETHDVDVIMQPPHPRLARIVSRKGGVGDREAVAGQLAGRHGLDGEAGAGGETQHMVLIA
jgi:hypothetical protein